MKTRFRQSAAVIPAHTNVRPSSLANPRLASLGGLLLAAAVTISGLGTPTTARAVSGVEVDGTVIRWQGSDWYQVQDAASYRTMPGCQGRINLCDVGVPGTYNIVSLSARREGIVVAPPVQPPASSGGTAGLSVVHVSHRCDLTPRGSIERQILGPNDRCRADCALGAIAVGGGCGATALTSVPPLPGADLGHPSSGQLDRGGYTCSASEGNRVTVTAACLAVSDTASAEATPASVTGAPELYYRETVDENGATLYVGRLRWDAVSGATAYDVRLDEQWIGTSHGATDNGGLAIGWSADATGSTAADARVQVIARIGNRAAAPSIDARLIYAPNDPALQ